MIQRYKILWAVCFISLATVNEIARAQAIIGAKNAALGNATTSMYENEWGLFSNPASIFSEEPTIGFYGLRHFGFPELTDISSILNMPILGGYSAIGLYRFGDNLYSETNINLGYKYNWQKLHGGVSFQYRHLKLGGSYGSGGALMMNIGILTQIGQSIWLGANIRNINRASYNFEFNDEELPQDMSIGISYKLEQKAVLVFDVLKDVRFPLTYRGGIEIEIIEHIVGRVGATYEPINYTFGLGYTSKKWQVNMVVQQHEILGSSPGADIILTW